MKLEGKILCCQSRQRFGVNLCRPDQMLDGPALVFIVRAASTHVLVGEVRTERDAFCHGAGLSAAAHRLRQAHVAGFGAVHFQKRSHQRIILRDIQRLLIGERLDVPACSGNSGF